MEDIKAELVAQLQNKTAFEVPIFGGIAIPQSVSVSWGIIILLTALAIFLTRGMQLRPTGKRQMIAEWLVGFINDFCKDSLGHHWRTFAPYLGSVGLYLACANLSGLFGVTPPTKDLNVTAGLALMSVVLIYGASFRVHGLGGGLKKFAEPVAIVAPLNILEIGIRPLSLCMRLFGNIFAGFVIMELIKMVIPVVLPIPFSLYFDVFDGMIQAVVFVFLTTLFLAESIE